MKIENEFIPYEQALDLKELGFDESCLSFKDFDYSLEIGDITKNSSWSSEIISIPLYQQAFRWFREKYGLSSSIISKMSNNKRKVWYLINELDNRIIPSMYFKSYPKGFFKDEDEAELECLKKLIEIVKEQK